MEIIPPIIIDDSGDIIAFKTIEGASSYLEPYFLEGFTAYDSTGKKLTLSLKLVKRKWKRWFWQREKETEIPITDIYIDEDSTFNPQELKEKLIVFFNGVIAHKTHVSIKLWGKLLENRWEELSLAELVEIITDYGYRGYS